MITIQNYRGLIGEDLNDWYSVSEAFVTEDEYGFVVSSYLDKEYSLIFKLSRFSTGGFYELSISEQVAASRYTSTIKQLPGNLLLNRANISNKHAIIRNMLSLAQSHPDIPKTKKQRQ